MDGLEIQEDKQNLDYICTIPVEKMYNGKVVNPSLEVHMRTK